MAMTATIAGAPVTVMNTSPNLDDRIEERTRFSFTVIDLAGTATYSKGQPVEITDSILGTVFTGFVNQPKATLLYPNPARMWAIDCVDETWLADKRTSNKIYKNQFAGTIAVDQIQRYGSADGLTCNAALRWDELETDWTAGTLSNTAATTNATDGNAGDGDLELALAGSQVVVSGVGSGFAFGNGLMLTGYASSGYGDAYVYRQIWSGSHVINANTDFLQYDIWIASTSPQIMAGIDIICSDGTTLRSTNQPDQQGISCSPASDLSGLANDTWYTRTIGFPLSMNGKTAISVLVAFEGNNQGTYTAYFQNIGYYTFSGGLQFWIYGPSSALQMNSQASNNGYSNVALTTVSVATTKKAFALSNPALSIGAAEIVQSSRMTWDQVLPVGCSIIRQSSIDGGVTSQTLSSGSAVPNLLPGMSIAGRSIQYLDVLTLGTDPTVVVSAGAPTLTVDSAYQATKSDSITTYQSTSDFGTGTYTNLMDAGSGVTLNGVQRDWDDANFGNQTLFGANGPFQAIINKQLQLSSGANLAADVRSRLDFAGLWQDFVAEVDVQIPSVSNVAQSGLVYRCTGWQNANDTYAYVVAVSQTQISLGHGTNSSSGSGTFTLITQQSVSLTSNSIHRLKVVVNGNAHQVYLDGVLLLSATDATYPNAGYLGLRSYNPTNSTLTALYDNFGVCAALSGTWQSPSINIASPGAYGNSVILWDNDIPDTCTIEMQSSIDGGATWQAVSFGGAVSGLVAGQSLAGKTLLLKMTLTAANAPSVPTVDGVSAWIVGQYSSSGTRISPSLALSPVGRAGTALVNWNANLPVNTSLVVQTSIDQGVTWQNVASPGGAISGIATQPAPVVDTFATNDSGSYTQSNFASGATGIWTWDTANSRLVGSGGTNGTIVNSTALTAADNQVMASFDQCDGSGLIANYIDANDLYFVQIWDGSGTGTQNAVKLFKRSGGTTTQLGTTATIAWTRGNYKQFILDVQAGVITVSLDGVQLIQVTDGSPLGAGKAGLLLNTLVRCHELRIQQYGQNVSALSLLTKLTLTSTDPTATPQVLDLQAFVSSTDIGAGVLIDTANYVRTYLSANLADLNQKCGTTWTYVRPDKSVVFQDRTATPAPWILDSANETPYAGQQQGDVLLKDLELDTSGDLYRNRQILTGVIGTSSFTEVKHGDGSTRTWNVANPLTAPPTIILNGQTQTVGIRGVDTGKQYYYQIGSTAITQDSSGTLLADTDNLVIAYTGSYITEAQRDNATPGTFPGTTSQAEMAIIDGTSGIVENVIDVSSQNMTVAAAQAYGDQLLQRYGKLAGRTLTFSTLRPGLAPGQQLTAFVPWQQCIDVQFLITSVNVTAESAQVPGGVLYWYKVEAVEGATLGSWVRLLASGLNG